MAFCSGRIFLNCILLDVTSSKLFRSSYLFSECILALSAWSDSGSYHVALVCCRDFSILRSRAKHWEGGGKSVKCGYGGTGAGARGAGSGAGVGQNLVRLFDRLEQDLELVGRSRLGLILCLIAWSEDRKRLVLYRIGKKREAGSFLN